MQFSSISSILVNCLDGNIMERFNWSLDDIYVGDFFINSLFYNEQSFDWKGHNNWPEKLSSKSF